MPNKLTLKRFSADQIPCRMTLAVSSIPSVSQHFCHSKINWIYIACFVIKIIVLIVLPKNTRWQMLICILYGWLMQHSLFLPAFTYVSPDKCVFIPWECLKVYCKQEKKYNKILWTILEFILVEKGFLSVIKIKCLFIFLNSVFFYLLLIKWYKTMK